MSQKKRKYQDNHLDFGFTYLIEADLQIPQCVVCMKPFSNSTMKPASLTLGLPQFFYPFVYH